MLKHVIELGWTSDIPETETQTDTEMIDISKTHTETNTEKVFNTDTIYI